MPTDIEFLEILEKVRSGELVVSVTNGASMPVKEFKDQYKKNVLEVNGKPYELSGCPVIVTDESGQATVTTLSEPKVRINVTTGRRAGKTTLAEIK